MTEMRNLSTEELRVISLEKRKKGRQKGCATPRALIAQRILYERAGCPFSSSTHWKRDNITVDKIF